MVMHCKKVISIILSLIIICFIPLYASAESIEIVLDSETLPLYASAGPNVEELENYVDIDEFRAYLIEGLASCPASLDISKFKIPYTSTTLGVINRFIFNETPEIFQTNGRLGGSTSGGYLKTIKPSYRFTATEYAAMLPDFYEGAATLLRGIRGNNKLSDVEKALLLHDRLVVWCEYDYANYLTSSIPDESYSAYGVFAKKTAVCMGYALAYDYLLWQVGIDSYYCSSDVLFHAWNIVYVNDSSYHVDVTWDDPSWDKSGRVYHNNFLRSSTGMIETEHISDDGIVDYDTTPTDTTFDSYYWQNSTASFQLVDDDIYYIDNSAETLNKISDGVTTVCRSVSGLWRASSSNYWSGNFSYLAFDGKNLLFTLPTAVYKYDTKTGASTVVFNPSKAQSYYCIFGFKFDDCKLVCEVLNTPNYDENTKANYTQTQTHHVASDWIISSGPTLTATGLKHTECINCALKLEEATIPTISVTATNLSEIDYVKCLIFTDVFTCDSINDLVTASGSTSVSTADSASFLGTGTVIIVSNNGEDVSSLTIIVNGDLNGDSVCDVLDVQEAQRYSVNIKTPTENEIYAANGTVAESITLQTYQDMVNKALAV